MPPRALLLDFDGVIADTENVHIAAWQRTFAAMGWEVSDETCARSMEIDDRQFLAEVFAKRKIEGGNVEGWVRRKQELTLSLLSDAPRVYPGVKELVECLRGEVVLAVVSTTWPNIITVLKSAGLYPAFRLIVGKEDVHAPKPDPESYKLAVKGLGVRAKDAVALEDTATGLASARGAGVSVVAVGHRLPPGAWTGAAPYLPDLRRTDEVLAKIGLP